MLNIRVGGILIPTFLSICWGMVYALKDTPVVRPTATSLNFKTDLGTLYALCKYLDTVDGIHYTSKVLTEARFGEGASKLSGSFKTLMESLKNVIDAMINDGTKQELLVVKAVLPTNEEEAIQTLKWYLKSTYDYVFEFSRKMENDWSMIKDNPMNSGLVLEYLKKCGLKDTDLRNSKLSDIKPAVRQTEEALKTLVELFKSYAEPKAEGSSGLSGASTDAVPSRNQTSSTPNDVDGQNGAEQSTPTKDSATTPFISSLGIIALLYLSLR